MIIAVDFDGTLADHRFPDIGTEVPGAIRWCKAFQAAGANLILWTMRSDGNEGPCLTEAVNWCRERGLEFWAANENPEQHTWTSSRKCYAHLYIDDAAACCPLRENPRMGGRPYVDWDVVGPTVMAKIEAAKMSKS